MFRKIILILSVSALLFSACASAEEVHPSVGIPVGETILQLQNEGDQISFYAQVSKVNECSSAGDEPAKAIIFSLIATGEEPLAGYLCKPHDGGNISEEITPSLSIGWEGDTAYIYLTPEGQKWEVVSEDGEQTY